MTSHQLWLKIPRSVLRERGFGVSHLPRDVETRLSGTGWAIDPMTGFLCAKVKPLFTDVLTWPETEGFQLTKPFPLTGGEYADGLTRSDTGAWTVTSVETLSRGRGFFLGFIPYAGGKPFRVSFGGRYTLSMDEGIAELKRGANTLAYSVLYEAEEWAGRIHYLYVYNVGSLLCLRRMWKARDRGMSARIADPVTGGFALDSGKVRVDGDGYLTFSVARERHETAVDVEHEPIVLPEKCTTQNGEEIVFLAPPPKPGSSPPPNQNEPRLRVTNADGDEIGGDGEDKRAFAYRIEVALDDETSPNVYVSRVRVWWPPKIEPDGLVGLNLLALPGAKVRSVEDRRSLDPQSCGIGFEVAAGRGVLSPYVQANMRGIWAPGGQQRADFFTSEPECELKLGYELLRFHGELGWKRFQTALWAGEGGFGGRLLAEAYRDVARRTGLESDEIVIYSGGYTLPPEEADGPPLFDFRPGQPIAEILTYLRDSFGEGDLLRFRPDGKLYAEPKPTGHSGLTFLWTTPAAELLAVGQGTSTVPRILRGSWKERLTEQGFANEVWVVGQDRDEYPIVAFATDWPSINDPSAWNYVGEVRRMIVVDGGLTHQGVVSWVCRNVFLRVRQLRVFAQCRAVYRPELLEGSLVDVDGRGTWRILSMTTRWDHQGPQGIAEYELEMVR